MEISISNPHQSSVTLRGTCPHCARESAFLLMTSLGASPQGQRLGGLQCQACTQYILGVFTQPNQNQYVYVAHYPVGKPDETVAEEVPEHIRVDFQEAMRCQFVKAYNATAEMCRRALEATCIDLGAPKKLKVLEDKIDWLADQLIITPHMKNVAHKIRLGGNRGAHPPEDGPKIEVEEGPVPIIEEEHAKAIVIFTREFFHHVYVVPKQLDKYDFSKPKTVIIPKVVS